MKLRKGDLVRVIAGKDIGKEGTISRVMPDDNKVIVEGVNLAKRHTKARKAGDKPDIVEKAMPLDASNVMLVHKGKTTRIGFRLEKDGRKIRIAKTTGDEV
jgi:large subunit ribosomal protein L24